MHVHCTCACIYMYTCIHVQCTGCAVYTCTWYIYMNTCMPTCIQVCHKNTSYTIDNRHVKGLETELRDYVNIILLVFDPRYSARYWREITKHETTALLTGIFVLATDKYTSQECVCRVIKIRYMPWYRRKLMPFIQSSRICTIVFIYLYILRDYLLESQNLNFTSHFH